MGLFLGLILVDYANPKVLANTAITAPSAKPMQIEIDKLLLIFLNSVFD